MVRLVAVGAQVAAARQGRARLAVRAALTAKLHGLPWVGLALEALARSPLAALDELSSLTLTAIRLAAAALGADEGALLGALLVDRTAVEAEQARGEV